MPCAQCGSTLAGRYCHDCGQDTHARPQPLREMVKDVAVSYSPIDGKLARTLGALLLRPGQLLEAYRAGAGSRYVTPLKLFVAATALFLTVLNFSSIQFYQYTWKAEPGAVVTASVDPEGMETVVHGAAVEERWLRPIITPAIDPEVIAALEAGVTAAPTEAGKAALRYDLSSLGDEERVAHRLSAWLPNVLWLLMPLYAVGLMPLFGRRRLFLEHVIFAMWAHAIVFVTAMMVAGINRLGGDVGPGWLLPPYLGYFTLAASRYYRMSWIQALWRGVVHALGYVLLVLFPASMIIYATGMDFGAWMAWVRS